MRSGCGENRRQRLTWRLSRRSKRDAGVSPTVGEGQHLSSGARFAKKALGFSEEEAVGLRPRESAPTVGWHRPLPVMSWYCPSRRRDKPGREEVRGWA